MHSRSMNIKVNGSRLGPIKKYSFRGCLSGLAIMFCQPCYGDIIMRHSPAHPLANEKIEFAVKAIGNVDRIEIVVDHEQLSVAADGSLSKSPLRTNIQVASCTVPMPYEILWCFGSLENGFSDGSLITARAIAGGPDGEIDTEIYQFAAGAYPFSSDPIPIRVTGSSNERLDIVFVPAEDVEPDRLRRQLSSLINDQYFSYEAFKGVPGYPYRRVYNFFYTPEKGNYEHTEGEKKCEFTRPKNYSILEQFADAIAILHEAELRNCRQGILMSSEIIGGKSLFHESGHALFGLLDEYCCDSYYKELDFAPNIWESADACEADASNIGYSTSMCARISSPFRTIPFWRVDPTIVPGSLMGQSKSLQSSTFLNASMRRILWRYNQCLAEKRCTPEALVFGNSVSESLASEPEFESMEGSLENTNQPQELVELQRSLGEQLRSIGKEPINWGPAAHSNMEDSSDITLQVQLDAESARILEAYQGAAVPSVSFSPSELGLAVLDKQGNTVYVKNIDDPRWVEIEGEEWQLIDNIPVSITLPKIDNASELIVAPINNSSFDRVRHFDQHELQSGLILLPPIDVQSNAENLQESMNEIIAKEPGDIWRLQLGDLLNSQ